MKSQISECKQEVVEELSKHTNVSLKDHFNETNAKQATFEGKYDDVYIGDDVGVYVDDAVDVDVEDEACIRRIFQRTP